MDGIDGWIDVWMECWMDGGGWVDRYRHSADLFLLYYVVKMYTQQRLVNNRLISLFILKSYYTIL